MSTPKKKAEKHKKLTDSAPGLIHWIRLPAFVAWISVSCGIALCSLLPWSYFYKVTLPDSFYPILISFATIFLTLLTIVLKSVYIRSFLFLLFGTVVYYVAVNQQISVFGPLDSSDSHSFVTGQVVSIPSPSFGDCRFLIKIKDSGGCLEQKRWKNKIVRCTSPNWPPLYGKIRVEGVFEPPAPQRNPGDFDEYSYMLSNDIWGKIKVDTIIVVDEKNSFLEKIRISFRQSLLDQLNRMHNENARAVLRAAFLNEAAYLTPEVQQSFRLSGIYHLLSISGLHTGMIMAALFFFLNFFPIRKSWSMILALTALWLYTLFIGIIPPLFRATVMASLMGCAFLFEKKSYPLQALGLAGLFWLTLSPQSLFLPGYQLSFFATFGIIVLHPVLIRFRPSFINPAIQFMADKFFSGLYISIAGLIATVPVLLFHFGSFSIISILSNIIAVPMMSLVSWLYLIGCIFNYSLPFAAKFFAILTEGGLQGILSLADYASKVPLNSLQYGKPAFELIILYSITMVGFATVNKKILYRYFILMSTFWFVLLPLDMFVHYKTRNIQLAFSENKKSSIITIRTNNNEVITFFQGRADVCARLLERSVIPWVRTDPIGRFTFVTAPVKTAVKACAVLDSNSTNHSNLNLLLLDDKKMLRAQQCQALIYPHCKVISNGIYTYNNSISWTVQESYPFSCDFKIQDTHILFKPKDNELEVNQSNVSRTLRNGGIITFCKDKTKIREFPLSQHPTCNWFIKGKITSADM